MHPSSAHTPRTSHSSDALTCYLREIRAFPLLTHDEECKLADRAREIEEQAECACTALGGAGHGRIARARGITRERVRQIEERALSRRRKLPERRALTSVRECYR